jgi:hypothetical protein
MWQTLRSPGNVGEHIKSLVNAGERIKKPRDHKEGCGNVYKDPLDLRTYRDPRVLREYEDLGFGINKDLCLRNHSSSLDLKK